MEELQATLADLDKLTGHSTDLLTVIESRLFDQKITQHDGAHPAAGAARATWARRFGWRIDPFTGRSALHTGLDFQADPGTPILAAAGGVVVAQEFHPAYGNMVEVDHGNDLVTRYAHASRLLVKKGDLVKRGQKIADVGTTGRSTGPHLHFEVLVQGVPQDPQKFLAGTAGTCPARSRWPAAGRCTGTRSAPQVKSPALPLLSAAIALAAVQPHLHPAQHKDCAALPAPRARQGSTAFMANNFLTQIFGSRNDRLLKQYRKTVERINALEPQFEQLSDDAAARQDRRIQGPRGQGRGARRPAARSLRRRARRLQARHEDAPLRRPAAWAAWRCTTARSPRCAPAKARP